MNRTLELGILLAQQTRLDSLSRGLQGRPLQTRDIVIGGIIMAAIVTIACLASFLMHLHERRRSYNSRRFMFLSLCWAHRLWLSECWLLWKVARSRGLDDPARLFLEPEHLDQGSVGKPLSVRTAMLRRLRRKLFAEPEGWRDADDGSDANADQTEKPSSPMAPTTPIPTLDVGPWTEAIESSAAESTATESAAADQ